MRIAILFVLLACIAQPADAGKLFACRDTRGHVSFIDHGCPQAHERREIVLVAAIAESKSAADIDAKRIAAWDKASRARLPASLGGTANGKARTTARHRNTRPSADNACANARTAQARAERERSFAMDFDERRRLSDAVLSACGLR